MSKTEKVTKFSTWPGHGSRSGFGGKKKHYCGDAEIQVLTWHSTGDKKLVMTRDQKTYKVLIQVKQMKS